MTRIESSVHSVGAPQAEVYARLSDLSGLSQMADQMPQDQMSIESCDVDHITLQISPVGRVSLQIVERTPHECIKLTTTESPLPFTLWTEILPVGEAESRLKVTVGLEINLVMAAMIRRPLEEGVERMADALTAVFSPSSPQATAGER